MRRPLLLAMVLVCLSGVGCGGDKNKGDAAEAGGGSLADQIPDSSVTSQPSVPGVEETVPAAPLEGVFIRPMFDAGGATERSVNVGEAFDVLVFAETVEPYSTNCAQFRLDVPPGVTVTGLLEFEHKTISAGNRETNYMIAYDCQPGGKFRLVTFNCVAEAGFQGGAITVAPGLPGNNETYLGFVTCEFAYAPSGGGSVTIKKK